MTVHHDLEFYLGEHWIIDFEVNDGDGENIDITGASASWRLVSQDGTAVMTRTVGDGVTITAGPTGLCTLAVTPAHQVTGGVQANTNYKWEFSVTTLAGTISVQALGALYVHPSLLAA